MTTAAHLQAAEDSVACKEFLVNFNNFQETVRHGNFEKTAQFWMQYCDCVWTLLTFQRAVKENDLDLFIKSMTKMCGLLLSADHLNYSFCQWCYTTQVKLLCHGELLQLLTVLLLPFSLADLCGKNKRHCMHLYLCHYGKLTRFLFFR